MGRKTDSNLSRQGLMDLGQFQNYDLITILLFSAIALSAFAAIFFWSLKRYEIAIILLLLTPWVNWLFSSNGLNGPEEMLVVGTATYIRISIVVLIGIIGFFSFFKTRSLSHERLPSYLVLFGVFLIYALVSSIYSIDMQYSIVRSVEFLAFFGFLLGFFSWLTNNSRLTLSMDIFFWIIICGIVINTLSLLFLPNLAWYWNAPNRFQGLTGHPNTLGALCMISYPVLLWKYQHIQHRYKIWVALVLCAVIMLHLFSGSRASLAASVFGFTVWYSLLNNKALALILIFMTFFGSVFLLQVKPSSFERSESKRITDFTGRSDFWLGSIELIKERPLFGYGYDVGGKIWDDPRFNKNQYLWIGSSRTSLHNGYLNIAIGLGITGLLIWAFFIIPPIWRCLQLPSSYYKAFILVILFQALLINFFETSITSSRGQVSLVFWFCWILALRLPYLATQKNIDK